MVLFSFVHFCSFFKVEKYGTEVALLSTDVSYLRLTPLSNFPKVSLLINNIGLCNSQGQTFNPCITSQLDWLKGQSCHYYVPISGLLPYT